jgi:hypothetical protein
MMASDVLYTQAERAAAVAAERERCAALCLGIAEVVASSATGARKEAGMRAAQSCAKVIMSDHVLELRQDAKRYQYLRANMTGVMTLLGAPAIGLSGVSGDDMDAAIDAAIGAA